MANKGIVIDIETTGLNPNQHVILELSAIIYNRETFEEIDTFSETIVTANEIAHLEYMKSLADQLKDHKPTEEPYKGAKIVYDMHKKSGLFDEIMNETQPRTMTEVRDNFLAFMKMNGLGKNHIQLPATGSSIHFDMKFLERYMPEIVENLHYRQINVSTLKVIVDQYMPALKQRRIDSLKPVGAHRGLSDCRDTLGELKFYYDYLIEPMEIAYRAGD